MKNEAGDKLPILQANDHFRNWRTLDDERVCILCGRNFTGHDVAISTVGDESKLHCPTPNCQSGVHQWAHPGNSLLPEQTYEGWWHALGSARENDNTGGEVSPQAI